MRLVPNGHAHLGCHRPRSDIVPFFGSIPDSEDENAEERAFRDRCRRHMARPIEEGVRYGFCRVCRPLLEDVGVRVFNTTKEYRKWCAANLPACLGFQLASEE